MILKDGVKWDGWQDHLKSILGANNMKLTKNAKFEVADRYKGFRDISKAGGQFAWTKSEAPSVGCPVEFSWVDEKGSTSLIKYVEHTEKQRVGDKVIDIELPGSLYIRDGKFEVTRDKLELFWFHMVSPYNENGFYYDTQWRQAPTGTVNRWNISKTQVETSRMLRTAAGIFPKYKYVDEGAHRKSLIERDEMRFEARQAIEKMTEADMREMFGGPFGQADSQTEDIDVIKLFLISKARSENDDEVKKILNADTEQVSMLNLVNQAEQMQVIAYKKGGRAWQFADESAEQICLVTKGSNPTNFLVEWLRSKDDGKQVYNAIKAKVKEVEQAKKQAAAFV